MEINNQRIISTPSNDGVRRLIRTLIVVAVARAVGTDIVLSVGRRIRELRSERGVTQEELAAKLGIATKNMQRLESGRQNLTLRTLQNVAVALGVEPRVLLDRATSAADAGGEPSVPEDLEPLTAAGFDLLPATAQRRPRGATPVMSMRAAVNKLGGTPDVELLAWLRPKKNAPLPGGSLIVQMIGESMEPLVPAGSWCLLHAPVLGALEGRIVLVEHHRLSDPETGGAYALKKIAGFEVRPGGRYEVRLESINPRFDPIAVPIERMDELHPLAELDRVLIDAQDSRRRSR